MDSRLSSPSPPLPANLNSGDARIDDDELSSLAVLAELALLIVVLCVGRALQRAKFQWLGEAGAALLVGMVVGLLLRAVGAGDDFKRKIAFRSEIFLFVLLPTIMFDAGYSLDAAPFIRNIGSICAYAFLGTTISTFVVGLMMWGFGAAGACYYMGPVYNLMFGALISATDPVTVLSVFQRLSANEDLYINVFGESVLNDAVGMVLYNLLKGYVGITATAASVFRGIGLFIGVFLGSVVVGLAVGLAAALLFRTRWFAAKDAADSAADLFETGMVVVLAFTSYLGANACYLSGICSVLFCGMFMKAYVRPNLSHTTEVRVESLFKALAGLFELFLFIYIGLSLFLAGVVFNIFGYTALCLVALAVSRAANIVPCSILINFLRKRHQRVPAKQQFMMWWAGLRGAMAFALAVDAAEEYGKVGEVMKTVTFYLIFVTVLINGGTCPMMLDWLDLRQGPCLPSIREDDAEEEEEVAMLKDAKEPGAWRKRPELEIMPLVDHHHPLSDAPPAHTPNGAVSPVVALAEGRLSGVATAPAGGTGARDGPFDAHAVAAVMSNGSLESLAASDAEQDVRGASPPRSASLHGTLSNSQAGSGAATPLSRAGAMLTLNRSTTFEASGLGSGDEEGGDSADTTNQLVPKALHPVFRPLKNVMLSMREFSSGRLEQHLADLDAALVSRLVSPGASQGGAGAGSQGEPASPHIIGHGGWEEGVGSEGYAGHTRRDPLVPQAHGPESGPHSVHDAAQLLLRRPSSAASLPKLASTLERLSEVEYEGEDISARGGIAAVGVGAAK